MIRQFFKKNISNKKIDAMIKKYNIPKSYLSINRKTVANGVFIGLFFSMMPMPMQMLAVIFCTPLVTFNVPLSLTLVWISNPFSMPFIMYAQYLLGDFILGNEKSLNIELTLEWFQNNLDTIFTPLIVGALSTGLFLAFLGRFLILFLWKRSVHKERKEKTSQTKA
jgi:uncharacterized protein (DUF2062 family)